MTDPYTAFLDSRGTRSAGATADAIASLKGSHVEVPSEVLSLLSIQDGEDPLKTFRKRVQFYSASEILDSLSNLRSMVIDDETLPSCMLEFVPFLTTDVKTDVGVFSAQSSVRPGHVAELDYESGGLVWWAPSVQEFVAFLDTAVRPKSGLGHQFPAEGMTPDSVYDLPGQPYESE